MGDRGRPHRDDSPSWDSRVLIWGLSARAVPPAQPLRLESGRRACAGSPRRDGRRSPPRRPAASRSPRYATPRSVVATRFESQPQHHRRPQLHPRAVPLLRRSGNTRNLPLSILTLTVTGVQRKAPPGDDGDPVGRVTSRHGTCPNTHLCRDPPARTGDRTIRSCGQGCAVGRIRISLSVTRWGRVIAKAMISAMS